VKGGWLFFPSVACTGADVDFGWRKEVGSLSLRLPIGVGLSNMVAQVVLAVVAKHVEVSFVVQHMTTSRVIGAVRLKVIVAVELMLDGLA